MLADGISIKLLSLKLCSTLCYAAPTAWRERDSLPFLACHISCKGASLLCSVLLVRAEHDPGGGELSLCSAIAARDAIAKSTDVVPTIKWPNDLLVGNRKLGGILIESRLRRDGATAFVVGFGINCLQQRGHLADDLADTATSLELESKQATNRTTLAISLLSELDHWLSTPRSWTDADLRREWLARSQPLGARIRLRGALRASVVPPCGRLDPLGRDRP